MRHCRFQIRDVEVGLETNHSARDILTKLIDLFSDISQKSITGPSSNHHDCVYWTLPQIHRHCLSWYLAMGAYLFCFKAQLIFSDDSNSVPHSCYHFCWCDMFNFVVFHTANTGVSPVYPGYFLIRFTSASHCLTGHRIICSEANCVTMSFLSYFFCHSKVIETQSAYSI